MRVFHGGRDEKGEKAMKEKALLVICPGCQRIFDARKHSKRSHMEKMIEAMKNFGKAMDGLKDKPND